MPAEVPSYLQQSAVQSSMKMRKKLQQIPEEFLSGYVLSFYMLWKYSEEITDMKIVETVACQYYQKLGRTLMSAFYEGKLLILLKEETTLEEVEKLRKLIFQFVTNRCYISITPYHFKEQDDQFFIHVANAIEVYGFYECGPKTVFMEKPLEINKTFPFDVGSYMEQLEHGIAKISETDIKNTLQKLFDEISGNPYLSVNLVKKLMIEILSRFSKRPDFWAGRLRRLKSRKATSTIRKL